MQLGSKPLTSGKGLVEYVLLLGLAVIGIALVLQLAGVRVSDIYCNIADALPGGDSCSQKELCADDFSANLSGWITRQGTAGGVQGGKYCPPSYSLMLNKCSMSNSPKDYTIGLDGAQLNSGNGFGIMFRVQELSTGLAGYAFQYDPGLGGFVFRKWAHNVEINPPLAFVRAPGYDWFGEPHDIQIKVQGDKFTAYIDGVAVLTAQDSSYVSGGGGLRTWDSTQACFDDFEIELIH